MSLATCDGDVRCLDRELDFVVDVQWENLTEQKSPWQQPPT
jgi:hypothetical protein